MPDLVDAANAERGDRPLKQAAAAPRAAEAAPIPARAPAPPVRPSAPPVLLFEQVSKWYGPVLGLNQVTLELHRGLTGLVGHNGAGKSTLLRLAAGQVRPDLGRVTIAGLDAWTSAAKLQVGYCPDLDVFYEEMSGRGFVETMARLSGFSRREARRRTGEVLDQVGMTDRADRPLRDYSKGMRQRIKLAQALAHDPPLLLLDEPLAGIDPVGRRELVAIFRRLAAQGKCLLLSSHELEELEKLTDHVAILASGRLAAVGPVSRIRDLLADHPLTIRVDCDRNRLLAGKLLELEEVVGLERQTPDGAFTLRAHHPERFFSTLNRLVIEEGLEMHHLETLDDSTGDVLDYLLGGRP